MDVAQALLASLMVGGKKQKLKASMLGRHHWRQRWVANAVAYWLISRQSLIGGQAPMQQFVSGWCPFPAGSGSSLKIDGSSGSGL